MSLRAKRIKRTQKDYKELLTLYQNAFPAVERFPVWRLRLLSHWKGVHSIAFYDGEVLCGFSYFLVNEATVFILFLAVTPKVRSKGYGSQILSWIRENYPDRALFLDVEKPDDQAANHLQREKRIAFYERNGVFDTGQYFIHNGVPYEILCTNRDFTEQDYNENLESHFRIFQKKHR